MAKAAEPGQHVVQLVGTGIQIGPAEQRAPGQASQLWALCAWDPAGAPTAGNVRAVPEETPGPEDPVPAGRRRVVPGNGQLPPPDILRPPSAAAPGRSGSARSAWRLLSSLSRCAHCGREGGAGRASGEGPSHHPTEPCSGDMPQRQIVPGHGDPTAKAPELPRSRAQAVMPASTRPSASGAAMPWSRAAVSTQPSPPGPPRVACGFPDRQPALT